MSNYGLKDRFLMETNVGSITVKSLFYDHYPTPKEIMEFIATLDRAYRGSGVRVVREHMLVDTRVDELEPLDNDERYQIVKTLEVKIDHCIRYMIKKPLYLILSVRMGKQMIRKIMPEDFAEPPNSYQGIPIMYVEHDLDEPLVCF